MPTLYTLLLLKGYFRWMILPRCASLFRGFFYLFSVTFFVLPQVRFELLCMIIRKSSGSIILVGLKPDVLNHFRMVYGSPHQIINWRTLIHFGTLQKEL